MCSFIKIRYELGDWWYFLVCMGCMVWSLSGGLRKITWVWCYIVLEWMSFVGFMNVLFDKLMCLYYGLFPMHDVMVYILLAICNYHGLHVGSVLPCLKALGGIKCCVRFLYLGTQWRLFRLCEAVERGPLCLCEAVVEDWFECCTLSLVWSSGEGKDVLHYFGSLRV